MGGKEAFYPKWKTSRVRPGMTFPFFIDSNTCMFHLFASVTLGAYGYCCWPGGGHDAVSGHTACSTRVDWGSRARREILEATVGSLEQNVPPRDSNGDVEPAGENPEETSGQISSRHQSQHV